MSAETKFKVGDTVLYEGLPVTVTSAGRHSEGMGMYYIKSPERARWCFEDALTAAPSAATLEELTAAVVKLAATVERLILELQYAPGGSGFAQAKASFDTQVLEHN
jgi:hypothetical protein